MQKNTHHLSELKSRYKDSAPHRASYISGILT